MADPTKHTVDVQPLDNGGFLATHRQESGGTSKVTRTFHKTDPSPSLGLSVAGNASLVASNAIPRAKGDKRQYVPYATSNDLKPTKSKP